MCRQAVESSGGPSEIECRQIADLLGDYLDGSLPRHTRESDRLPHRPLPTLRWLFINTYRGTIDAVRRLGRSRTAIRTPVTDDIAARRGPSSSRTSAPYGERGADRL